MKKNGKRKVRVVTKQGVPVFRYLSVCHNTLATKVPLTMPAENRLGHLGASPKDAEGSLGSWRCGTCSKPCKVSRQKNVAEKTQAEEVING